VDTENQEPRRSSRRDVLVGAGGALAGMTLLSPAAALAAQESREALPRLAGKQKFVWVTANIGDPFYKDGIAGMKEFTRIFGVPATIVGPVTNDIAGMTKTFAAVVADRSTTGIFSYFYGGFDAVKGLYLQAQKKGIPIVNGAGDWGGPRASFVGVKDEDSGNAAVNYIGKYLGGKGTVGFIGNTGVNLVREEKFYAQYWKDRFPNVKYVGNATHDGSAADALKQFQAYKQKNPSMDVCYFGDGLGPSIADALVSAAGTTKMVLRGFGASGIASVKAGKTLALIDRSPWDEEFYGFQYLFWTKMGRRVPDYAGVPTFVIDKTNIAKFSKAPYNHF
jgi:ABC-type sugar transport system substrate-binding protein